MTCTNQQVKILMKHEKLHTQEIAAAKAGMNVKSARKYLRLRKLPNEFKKLHDWHTRKDEFSEVWNEIEELLISSPGLQAKTIFIHLQIRYPGKFKIGQLRTLQRRLQEWKAVNGKEQEIIFLQKHIPGIQSQSDYTEMDDLNINIDGRHFKHLLFHFMLTYSRWEDVSICYEESFDSLSQGYEQAVWRLGAVAPEHRTDNLTAATQKDGGGREFTERWKKVMDHYGVIPSRNNPGKSNENGSIEKSHDLFKTDVDQRLMLRGNRDFVSLDDYKKFLDMVLKSRNCTRKEGLKEEMSKLKDLPEDKWLSPNIVPVRVSHSSTVQIEKVTYSVPSRLIGYALTAHVYYDKIQLYYGQKCLQEMPRTRDKVSIDYRHIIDGLIRKPGAFANYQYKESLFPKLCFREAYDMLVKHSPSHGHKYYLEILRLAKIYGEQQTAEKLKLLQEQNIAPLPEFIKNLLDAPQKMPEIKIEQPKLAAYDQLLRGEV